MQFDQVYTSVLKVSSEKLRNVLSSDFFAKDLKEEQQIYK